MKLASLALLLLVPTIVFGECPSFLGVNEERNTVPQIRHGGGPFDGLAPVGQSLLGINAGTDTSNATVKYALFASSAEDLSDPSSFPIQGCSHTLSVALKSPIDKSDKVTDLASLDGLANAFTLTVSYARYADNITLPDMRSILERLKRKSGNANISLTRAELEKHFGKGHPIVEEFEADGRVTSWFWGASATIGRESFEYVNFVDFEKVKKNERPWSLAAFLGSDVGQWTITGQLKLESSYKAVDSITRCRPIVGSADLDCLTGAPDRPNEEDGRQVSIEFRRMIADKYGISPTIHHDFEKDVTGIDVPLFLWQDKKGQLTGGLRVGWRDDTKDTEFGLFVAQPF